MTLLVDFSLFFIFIMLLVISGAYFVKSMIRIATFLKISEFVIGFILMAFATSVPELFVGISAALSKNTAIIMGTVIGSNIANLTIVIGIPILLAKGIKITSKKTNIDVFLMICFTALPLILMLLGNGLSWIDGIILITAFFAYASKIYKERKAFKKELENRISRIEIVTQVFIFIFSIILLYISSSKVVEYASSLALDLAAPPIIIGIFLVAIGTSLPELVAGTYSVIKKHSELTIGNIIGSVIMNSSLVLGVTALIHPITSDMVLFMTSGLFMVIIAFVFATFVESEEKLDWKEGLSLIMLYIFFIIIQFYIKGAL